MLLDRRRQVIDSQAARRRFAIYAGQERAAASAVKAGLRHIAELVDEERIRILALWCGGLMHDLRHSNLIPMFSAAGADMQEHVVREMARAGGADDTYSGSTTGNSAAGTLGQIFAKYEALALQMSMEEGAWFERRPGWLLRGSHDPFKIANSGFAAWRDAIRLHLDAGTFDEMSQPEIFLAELWRNLVAGAHRKSYGATDAWIPATEVRDPSRKLIFKSASDWFAYHRRFGRGSVLDAAFDGLEQAARDIALMRHWGTDPHGSLEIDVGKLIDQAEVHGDAATAEQLRQLRHAGTLDRIAGDAATPSDVGIAVRARHLQLQHAPPPSLVTEAFGHVAAHAATLNHNGVGYLEAIGAAFDVLMRGRDRETQLKIADLLDVGLDALVGHLFGRYAAASRPSGATTKVLDTLFRLDLLHWWRDAQTTAVSAMASHRLSRTIDRGYGELPAALRGELTKAGVDAEDWEKLRQLDLSGLDGRLYLMPDCARQIEGPDGIRLERALAIYFNTGTGNGLDAAGALNAATHFIAKLQPNPRTLLRLQMTQDPDRFKSARWQGTACLIGSMIAIGYLGMLVADMRDGKQRRDPRDSETWLAALLRGGGFVLYADALLSSAGRTPGYVSDGTIAGYPALENLLALLKGEASGATVINLFYAKMTLDWLVLANLQDALNPGFMARTKHRLNERNSQGFWLPLNRSQSRQYS
jgi:hypothetical protein